MPDLTQKKYEFTSAACAGQKNPFAVIRFQGDEGLNECYRFEIDLISKKDDVDLEAIIQSNATFTILRPNGESIPFHGVLAEFEQRQKAGKFTFYRAVLVPRLWWLSNTYYNQVFLNKDFKEMISLCLSSAGLQEGADFKFSFTQNYSKREYACQYNTTHLDFVTCLLELVGIYYFFEQGETREKVVFTDSAISHQAMRGDEKLTYNPPSGLRTSFTDEISHSFVCRQRLSPKSVTLKDYNYRRPDLEISGSAQVNEHGHGDLFIYGDHFNTPKDGEYLAKIRAEMYRCQERVFHGESTAPYLRPGYCFTMDKHYRQDFNVKHLTTNIHHQGSQACFLRSELRAMFGEEVNEPYYRNNFTAIPAERQFRPELKTEYTRFYGSIHAVIDAEGAGRYAELDAWGRYKVKLPFDLADTPGAKASHWIRMAQSYAGENYGAHFPLHKGTEVLLTFIDGDPDRPIIAGAVPNHEKQSPVSNRNQTQAVMRTAGRNQMVMEDMAGQERLDLSTPAAATTLTLGQSVGAHAGYQLQTQGKAVTDVQQDIVISGAANHAQTIAGNSNETVQQNFTKTVSGDATVAIGGTLAETVENAVTITHKNNRREKVLGGLRVDVGTKSPGKPESIKQEERGAPAKIENNLKEIEKAKADKAKIQAYLDAWKAGRTPLPPLPEDLQKQLNNLDLPMYSAKEVRERQEQACKDEASRLDEKIKKLETENAILLAPGYEINVEGPFNVFAGEDSYQHYAKNLVQWSDQKNLVNHGSSSSYFGGAVAEIFAGASSKLSMGAFAEATIGPAIQVSAGLNLALNLSANLELALSADLSVHPGVACALAVQRMYAGATRIQNVITEVKSGVTHIGTTAMKVDGGGLKVIT